MIAVSTKVCNGPCATPLQLRHLCHVPLALLRPATDLLHSAGRVGRAALQPILQRQERPGESNRLSPSLIKALSFFITLLNNMPDREFSLGQG